MKVIDCEQGSAEWKQARAGNVTACRVKDVLATIKSGEASVRRDYKAQLVAEILTGAPQEDGYTNAAMQWGTEQEPFARAAYELYADVMVDKVGFVLHPYLPRCGSSPDGLVGTNGLIEIKCPKTATHIQYLLGQVVPAEYIPQMQWQMACTGRYWNDFVSYDPRMPEHLQLFVKRLPRDDNRIKEIEQEVSKFNAEVKEICDSLSTVAVG